MGETTTREEANMKPFKLIVVALIVTVGFACAEEKVRLPEGTPTPRPTGEGWIDLFDQTHAGLWENAIGKKPGGFEIKDGVFHIPGSKLGRYFAYTGETFKDFELHVEFKVTPKANSGVFFRTNPKNPVQGGFEIQVLDDFGALPSKNSCGSLYDVATPMFSMSRPAGEWNSFDITCQGPHLVVVMNGWKVIDTDLSKMTMPIGKFDTPLAQLPQDGHIVLQDHGGEVWFRNLLVKKL